MVKSNCSGASSTCTEMVTICSVLLGSVRFFNSHLGVSKRAVKYQSPVFLQTKLKSKEKTSKCATKTGSWRHTALPLCLSHSLCPSSVLIEPNLGDDDVL